MQRSNISLLTITPTLLFITIYSISITDSKDNWARLRAERAIVCTPARLGLNVWDLHSKSPKDPGDQNNCSHQFGANASLYDPKGRKHCNSKFLHHSGDDTS